MKKEILNLFIFSKCSIDEISTQFECTNATVIRNLKKELGNEKYKEILKTRNLKNNSENLNKEIIFKENQKNVFPSNEEEQEFNFIELAPLSYEIDNAPRKELSSVPIQEIDFPDVVYMIVDKKIELEIKLLKDYPDWAFLPPDDLKRKAIEVYWDLKVAKRFCNKDQKVIKVPNTSVFKIVAPVLISRGISRIVSDDKLISL